MKSYKKSPPHVMKLRSLGINFSKTEVMGITRRRERVNVEIYLLVTRVKQVSSFKYLGCTTGKSTNSEKEFIKRIAIAKLAFIK